MFFTSVFLCSDSAEMDTIELTITVKVPKDILEMSYKSTRYKYCVFSSANELMKSPFEFFTGALTSTTSGNVIDRSLRKDNLLIIDQRKRMYILLICMF